MAMYNTFRDMYTDRNPGATPSAPVVMMCGAASSILSQTITYPIAVVRTKMQSSGTGPDRPVYKGTFDCFSKTYKSGGFRGLYAGILPNYVKAVPAISLG